MTVSSKTPLLDQIKTPQDLRRLEPSQLRQVADELRRETIDAVAVTGGHLGAGLGVSGVGRANMNTANHAASGSAMAASSSFPP